MVRAHMSRPKRAVQPPLAPCKIWDVVVFVGYVHDTILSAVLRVRRITHVVARRRLSRLFYLCFRVIGACFRRDLLTAWDLGSSASTGSLTSCG